MLLDLLNFFPAHTHPLTLVSDPDRLLAGEEVMQSLTERGFRLIEENDPVILRYRVEEARPFTPENPLIIVTPEALEDLPFDLYQQAYRLELSLHQFFPQLAYPILQLLAPDQIEILGSCQLPLETLSRQKTIEFILREVFAADPTRLGQPDALIAWLAEYHQRNSPLAAPLREALVARLKQFPIYQGWTVDLLIKDSQAFTDFIQKQWQLSLAQTLYGPQVKESAENYVIPFHQNPRLQALVPLFVREGTLQPVEVEDIIGIPDWAAPGVALLDSRPKRYAALIENLEVLLDQIKANSSAHVSWNTWQEIAQSWAELSNLTLQMDSVLQPEQQSNFLRLRQDIDALFVDWLKLNYRVLAAQRLPEPHQVHHVPHYLAYLRELGQLEKVVLIVLDGLSLTDWEIISSAWNARHINWSFSTQLLLAQVPTITAISRYALISGMRPAEFLQPYQNQLSERRAWQLFWARHGVFDLACDLVSLSYDRHIDQHVELENPRIKYWCLIDDTPDRIAHNALLGAADQQASLSVWLDPSKDQNSQPLENLIGYFLNESYEVFIVSDHGHVEATGFGQPAEGLLAETRGKRARIYQDHLAAKQVQIAFPDTILWENDGILPAELISLMPSKRNAFTYSGQVVVTHGGISIEEEIVPFIQITKEV